MVKEEVLVLVADIPGKILILNNKSCTSRKNGKIKLVFEIRLMYFNLAITITGSLISIVFNQYRQMLETGMQLEEILSERE